MPAEVWNIKDDRARANKTKTALVAMANTRLASRVGQAYADIVVSCLTCMDPDWNMMGEEINLKDKDGIIIGKRYIEQIVHHIHRLQV